MSEKLNNRVFRGNRAREGNVINAQSDTRERKIVGRMKSSFRETQEEVLKRAQAMPWIGLVRNGPLLIRGYWVFYD